MLRQALNATLSISPVGVLPDDAATNARRAAVETATGSALPTLDDEKQDLEEAMRGYNRALDHVRARLREDEGNKILADVTASYGFRRNCLAVRRYGRAAAAIGTLTATTVWLTSVGGSPASFLGAALVDALLGTFWWAMVTDEWVRRDAERYATQFFHNLLKRQPRL